ncbi:MAG: T9SS type A sorting domain-containing protein, partial [Bacteroidetes bacterium]|nr:T9SS type A sorting domain-containing protein [Bacteroidota bacterium]
MKTKLILVLVVSVVFGLGIYGFVIGENPILKTNLPSPVNNEFAVYGAPLDAPVSALSESFESPTFPPAGWLKLSPLGRVGWTRQTVGTTPYPGFTGGIVTGPVGGGSAVANVTYTAPAAQNIEWLITPQITNVQPGDSLKFWIRYWPSIYPDSFAVKISTTTQTAAAMTTPLFVKLFNGALDSGWVQLKFRIGNTVPAGSNIYIGFLETFFDGSAFSMDLVQYVPAAAPPPPNVWFEQTTPVTGTLASISASDDNNVWAAGYTSNTTGPPLLVRTTNGGTWTNALGTGIGASVPLFNIWAIDGNTALVTGSTASATFVYRTSNGGANWTQVFTQASGFIDAIVMSDANNGFMYGDPVGGRWSLWKTTNGGVNWDSTGMFLAQAGTEAGWNNSCMKIGSNIWFGTNNTRVYYSTNNGSNWTAQTTTGEANGYAVWFNSSTLGFVGGATMKMTDNSGAVWINPPGTPTGSGNFGGITGYASNLWYIRSAATVISTSNNGTSWNTAYTTPAGTFAHITKSRTGLLLYASKSNGQIAKYGVTTGVTPITTVADNYSLSQNYPNPFNPSTNIKFAIPQSGFVTLKIYNMLGKEVATLVSSNLSAGSYNYDFNASNLASGIYFYKLEAGNFSEVK